MNRGVMVGGPVNGMWAEFDTRVLHVPVPPATNRPTRPGERGFGVAIYEWEPFSGMWLYKGELSDDA